MKDLMSLIVASCHMISLAFTTVTLVTIMELVSFNSCFTQRYRHTYCCE